MAKFLKYGGILFLLLILALLAIPSLLPVEKYKNELITKVKEETGRDLVIRDKISLSLFPAPKITVSNIELSSLPSEQAAPILKINKAKASLAILPLMGGNIVISDILLENPDIYIARANDNNKAVNNDKIETNSESKPFQIPQLPFSIERLTIENGRVTYAQNEDKTTAENINLVIKNLFGQGEMEFIINSKILDENVSISGSIDIHQALMPIKAESNVKGQKLLIAGNFNLNDLIFNGDVKLQGNLKHLNSTAPAIPSALQQEYSLTTLVRGNKENISFGKLNFTLGEISAYGEGSYNLKKAIPTLNINVMPSDVLVRISQEQSSKFYKINVTSGPLKPLLECLKIDAKEFPMLLSSKISLVASGLSDDNKINIQDISLNIADATLRGSLGINLSPELKLSYNLDANKASSLLKLVGIKPPLELSDVKVKGETKSVSKMWYTDTYINLSDIDNHIRGSVDVSNAYKTNLDVTAQGNNLSRSLKQLLNQKDLSDMFGNFSFSTNITGKMPVFDVALNKYDISINNAKTSLSGRANIDLTNKPKITLDLTTSEINLDNSNSRKAGSTVANVNYNSASRWSKEKIDLSFLNSFDGIFTVSVPRLNKGLLHIDKLKAKALVTNGTASLETFTGNIYGGSIVASGHIMAKTGEIALNSELKQARLQDATPSYRKIKISEGTFDIVSKLKSVGTSENQYVNNLSGNINLNGTEGKISGIDLKKILDGLDNVRDLPSILKIFDNSFSEGQSAFNKLTANIIIKQGIASLTDCSIKAPSIDISANGNIDLPKYSLDVVSSIKIDKRKLPAFNVRLYGLLDNIQHKLDMKELQQYLVKNVLGNVLKQIPGGKGGAADILKNIMGGDSPEDPAATSDNKAQEKGSNAKEGSDTDRVEDAAKDLLTKGLKNLF